jgi:hypothetical protein
MSQPTKQEILEKYRHLIQSDDFAVLAAEELPSPEEVRREHAYLEYLGPLNGWYVWAKRQFGRVVTVIVFFGGFMQGIEYINKYSQIAYTEVASLIQVADEHPDEPAKEYRIVRPVQFAWLPEQSFPLEPPSTTTTTTTTTTPAPDSTVSELPPGSGIVPYSSRWEGWT